MPLELLHDLTEGRRLLAQREAARAAQRERLWQAFQAAAAADLGVLWTLSCLAEAWQPESRRVDLLVMLPRWRVQLRVRYALVGDNPVWQRVRFGGGEPARWWAVLPVPGASFSSWQYAPDRPEALARAERLEVPSAYASAPAPGRADRRES